MAINWYKKINGFAKIEIEGYFAERFINLTLNRKITIWDIHRLADGRITAKVSPREFKKLRKIARETRCRIKIIQKSGIPFFLFRYQKRKIFVLLIFLAIVAIGYYNSFIWKVEITGDFSIPIEELKEQLAEENIKVATKKSAIDIDSVKMNMALKRNDLAWVGVTLKGTKATVEIVEKVMPEKKELDGVPCNVVAVKDGIISKIYAKDGLAVVEKDDFVTKGQILISGIMTSELSGNRYVHADGEVIAKTWYTHKVKVPYQKDIVNKTGKQEKHYRIKLLNSEINFLNNDTNFEKYDTIEKTNPLKILNRFVLPLEVTEITYEELAVDTISYTKEQAEAIAQDEAMQGALQMIPMDADMYDNSIVVREYEEGIEAEVTIECLERIGTKEKLEG